jgi:predicted transcriptional regulator
MATTLTISESLARRLERVSSRSGKSLRTLLHSALKNQLDYEEWFLKAVDEGIASADRGELMSTAEVVAALNKQGRERARRSRKAA